MNKLVALILVGVVSVLLVVTAVGKVPPHNLVITGGGSYSFFQVVQKVVLYGFDSKTGKRTEEPSLTVSPVHDPMYLLVSPGKYDITVYVPWVSRGILLGQVVVRENEVDVFDTREIELPEELIVR